MGQKVLGSVFMVDSESGSDLHYDSSKEVVFGNLIVNFPPFGIILDSYMIPFHYGILATLSLRLFLQPIVQKPRAHQLETQKSKPKHHTLRTLTHPNPQTNPSRHPGA